MILSIKRLLVFTVAMVMIGLLPYETNAQQTLADVKTKRGLNDADVLSAVKTFMPRGGRDEYFGFIGSGNAGTMIVYGLPSMRIYKYVGVFAPEPWQGYGFDDESELMIKKGSLDNKLLKYGNMYYPALSETKGLYDGKYLFYSDGANSRIAVLGLDDFETKQVLQNSVLLNVFPSVAVTENTEYLIQTSQYPTPWDQQTLKKSQDFAGNLKSGVTFWKFEDTEDAAGTGHHIGRIIKEASFVVELPPFTLDYFDLGRKSSHDYLLGLAELEGKSYIYVIDYAKAANLKKSKVNDFSMVSLADMLSGNALAMIQMPVLPKSIKCDPSGEYFITASDESFVIDIKKVKTSMDSKSYEGQTAGNIPVIKLESVKHGSLVLGKKVMDIAFDYRTGVVYSSVFEDKKIIRWNYKDVAKESELLLTYKPSNLMTPQGNSAEPHSNYLTVVDKEGLYDNFIEMGPTRPGYQHLIDISSEEMRDIYTMTVPQSNMYGSVSVLRTTIKPIIRYPVGTNSRTGEPSTFRTLAGQEKIERLGNRVHVFGTLIRSHITPEIVEVNEGDVVTFHLTNLERAEDETHGFTVCTYGKHGSFEPGKTASLTFKADRAGVFPYYCTEFCSALHLEMEGIFLVKPKNYAGKEEAVEIKLTEKQLAGYKKNYEDKIVVINQTQDVINSVVTYLKENNYQNYPYVEALVVDALDQLEQAKMSRVNYEKYASEGKWKDAFLWAEQYWQYQVKTADVGLRAKKLLSEQLESKN